MASERRTQFYAWRGLLLLVGQDLREALRCAAGRLTTDDASLLMSDTPESPVRVEVAERFLVQVQWEQDVIFVQTSSKQ